MRQALGYKKQKRCEEITGRKYLSCWVRGGEEHYQALCWFTNKDADLVNYKERIFIPNYVSDSNVAERVWEEM